MKWHILYTYILYIYVYFVYIYTLYIYIMLYYLLRGERRGDICIDYVAAGHVFQSQDVCHFIDCFQVAPGNVANLRSSYASFVAAVYIYMHVCVCERYLRIPHCGNLT